MPISIQLTQYGAPSVLSAVETPYPEPRDGEVTLRMGVAAVNRADVEIRSGKWPIQAENPFPYTPGLEVVGEVDRIGAGVQGLRIGTLAMTMMQRLGGIHGIRPGGYQTHVRVPASTLAILPPNADPLALGAIGLAGVTALQGLARMALVPGARVLVQGATGGVGLMALQWLKAKGAVAVALSRSPRKAQILREFGAAEVLSSDECVAGSFDGVLEMLSGPGFGTSVECLRPGGHLVSVGGILGDTASFTVWELMQGKHLTGWSSENLIQPELQKTVDDLAEALEKGKILSPPLQTFALKDAARAHQLMESSGHIGRIGLVP